MKDMFPYASKMKKNNIVVEEEKMKEVWRKYMSYLPVVNIMNEWDCAI